jgi:hypothetical protein
LFVDGLRFDPALPVRFTVHRFLRDRTSGREKWILLNAHDIPALVVYFCE